MPRIRCLVLLPILALAAPAAAQQPDKAAPEAAPLFTGLGTLHRAITTKSPQAQRYFDQGLRLTYAFNHEEAIASFRQGTRLDSSCAMCWWGIALALGPNINIPMDDAAVRPAYDASRRALALAGNVTPVERALIQALATRYEPTNERRAALDSAYARAMRDVARRFPNDPDAATLSAEAVMDLSPWNYWTPELEPRPMTAEILATLERTIARYPDHPGACHFYIHLVELPMPEKAVPCAEHLASLMPAAGHIVHMPAHIYIRVGRYADAIRANEHATHADAKYIADRHPQGVYMIGYVPHNFHFLWAAASLAGNSAKAIAAAREATRLVPPETVRQLPFVEALVPTYELALARFGRWAEVLKQPAPPADLRYSLALHHYVRGLALARTGRPDAADREAAQLRTIAGRIPADQPIGYNTARAILQVASHVLAGEIAAARKQTDAAVRELRQATSLEDALAYDEPPDWYLPVRQVLGAVLLDAGRAADAERVYREDLRRNPNNGWSLFGLARSLKAQGKAAAAAKTEEAFRAAWAGADVQLTSSRF